jgi:hypothetical protein
MGYYSIEKSQLHSYLNTLGKILDSTRVNNFYPDILKFRNVINLLNPDLSEKINGSLDIDEASGLPGESAFTRLYNEKKIVKQERKSGKISPSKLESLFYQKIEKTDFSVRFSLRIILRKIDTSAKTAFFRVILDRFDITEGILVRYTLDLIHYDTYWRTPFVVLDGEALKYTESFRNEISMACQDESELAFLSLSRLKDVEIKRIVRGRLGPLWFNRENIPDSIKKILNRVPGSFILNFPLDCVDTEIKSDLNFDPFSVFYRDVLSKKASSEIVELAKTLKYNVVKERRLVLCSDYSESLKNELGKLGKWLIVM